MEKYLQDTAFLKKIDLLNNKEQFAKIIVLDWAENPVQDIVGQVTDGNINVDGKSAVRRTANLSVYIEDNKLALYNTSSLLSLNKKVKLSIGVKNTTDQYAEEEIIWFPQGLYVITSNNISHSTSGINVSLQLKDKMCLLNGDVGGSIPAPVTFHELDEHDASGQLITRKVLIFNIIQELLHHWGGEQLSKIIISDVSLEVDAVMAYNPIAERAVPVFQTSITSDGKAYPFITDVEVDGSTRIEPKTDIGYKHVDFYYNAGELVANAGDSITSILDKIKNYLGNYEYFYDLEGNFVFQEIKNYLNNSQSTEIINQINQGNYAIDLSNGKKVYDFEDSTLITSYTNSPQYSMIKNDFVIWGKRKNAENKDVPIRYHLAIDRKPQTGLSHKVFKWVDPEDGLVKARTAQKVNSFSELNSVIGDTETFYYCGNEVRGWSYSQQAFVTIEDAVMIDVTSTDWRTELYLQGVDSLMTGAFDNYYFAELRNEWPKLYDIWATKPDFYEEVKNNSSKIDFFLDFIDSSAAIGEFSVENIGRRTLVINNDDINCLFAPEIPNKYVIEADASGAPVDPNELQTANLRGEDVVLVKSDVYESVVLGGSANPAYEYIKELLYNYTNYNESIVLQCVPIYHLEPNTRIGVHDPDSGIFGDYVISNYSIQLNIGGTMSIAAVKAVQKI